MDEVKCVDCADWFSCCHSGKREKRLQLNRIASSDACGDFKPRRQASQPQETQV